MKKTSKQLESILSNHMHATPVNSPVIEKEEEKKVEREGEKDVRISIQVPESVYYLASLKDVWI